MTFNFFLNNALTYRDRRLKGARQLFDGWVSFCVVCSVGAAANVGVAAFLHDVQQRRLGGVGAGRDRRRRGVEFRAQSSRFTWGRYNGVTASCRTTSSD